MSLFDEFDKYSTNKLKGGRGSLHSERDRPSKLGASSKLLKDENSLDNSLKHTKYFLERPVESFRFSLSRGGTMAVITGSLLAAALLFAGGYFSAYVVYHPVVDLNAEAQNVIASLKPKARYNSMVGQPSSLDASSRPLEVVMSPETAGGKALVALDDKKTEMLGTEDKKNPHTYSSEKLELKISGQNNKLKQGLSSPLNIPNQIAVSPSLPVKKDTPETLLSDTNRNVSGPNKLGLGAAFEEQKKSKIANNSKKSDYEKIKVHDIDKEKLSNQIKLFSAGEHTGDFGYSLQVGAFSSKDNAFQMLERLIDFVPAARIDQGRGQSGRTLYYLRIGFVEKRAEANALVTHLKKTKKIKNGYVMRVRAPSSVQSR